MTSRFFFQRSYNSIFNIKGKEKNTYFTPEQIQEY